MKICIVSDSHDHREPLAAAVTEARALGAEAVLHCGDLIAPSTMRAIINLGLPIHLIHGNNAGDLVTKTYAFGDLATLEFAIRPVPA